MPVLVYLACCCNTTTPINADQGRRVTQLNKNKKYSQLLKIAEFSLFQYRNIETKTKHCSSKINLLQSWRQSKISLYKMKLVKAEKKVKNQKYCTELRSRIAVACLIYLYSRQPQHSVYRLTYKAGLVIMFHNLPHLLHSYILRMGKCLDI